ncbi:hypothetical protein CRE_29215 [Caenorhabditis remanei]|uniref:SET domain-containing protein n=1 Tax=Caenorhabditis remanei TaxID=31234 RepID=E3NHU8_CAERE|nr:hypothetical protein CRE_29215 [Caenorhabditis remanei]
MSPLPTSKKKIFFEGCHIFTFFRIKKLFFHKFHIFVENYIKFATIMCKALFLSNPIPNSNEKSTLSTVLKDAVNKYTPIVKGFIHPKLVGERPAGVREKVFAFRKKQKARLIDEDDKKQGVIVREDIGTGGWILEMTGRIYLGSEVKERSEMEGENCHHLYDGIKLGGDKEPICMSVWRTETVGKYIRRSCQPTCELRHLFGSELHLIVVARKPMKRGDEVTLALDSDCLDFQNQLKCIRHKWNPEDCPLEKQRLLKKAQKESPAAYTTVVTLTDSGDEMENIEPIAPRLAGFAGPSSSDASSRPSPALAAPPSGAILQGLQIQGPYNRRENEENLPVAQVPTTSPKLVDPPIICIHPLSLRDPIATSPPAPRLNFPLPSFNFNPMPSTSAKTQTLLFPSPPTVTRNKYSEETETILRPHFTIPPAHHQEIISNIKNNPRVTKQPFSCNLLLKDDVGKDELLFEMNGYFKKRSEENAERSKRHHIVIDGMPLSLETWQQDTLAKNMKRSCQPNCRLTFFYGEELHIFVTSNEAITKNSMITLPVEPDFWESDEKFCPEHMFQKKKCSVEDQWMQRMTSVAPVPQTPLEKSPIDKPDSEDGDQAEIDDPVENDDAPVMRAPQKARSPRAVNDVASSSSSGSNNADPESAQEPMDAPEAAAQEPEVAPAPVDVADVPSIARSTKRRRRTAGNGRAGNGRLHNVDPEPAPERMDAPEPIDAPEPMDAPEAAAQEPEEAAAPVDVATPAPPTRRRLQSASNGQPTMRIGRSAALDLTEPEQVDVPVNVAGPTRRTRHRSSKKTTGATVARVQKTQSRNSTAVTLPITDRHTRHTRPTVRSAPVLPTIHNAPVAPPAGRKNRKAQHREQAAYARSCKREQIDAGDAVNVDPAPAPPAAPMAPAVVDPSTTRRRRASQALSPVAPVSIRRRAASPLAQAIPHPARPAVPRRSAPAPSAPPAVPAPVPTPRAREVSVARQELIALIGQSMHPTRAAVKQLRDKNSNQGHGKK